MIPPLFPRLAVALVTTASVIPWAVAQQVMYVDVEATGTQIGTSWGNAFTDLQDALGIAQPEDEIRIADGTYKPDGESGDRVDTFFLLNGVTIQGGYAGFGAPDPNERDPNVYVTILSGDIGTPDDATDNSYHVVTASGTDSTAFLGGVTISGGRADAGYPDHRGGGMVMLGASPTIARCRFQDNYAQDGGGAHTADGSSPTISDCVFLRNTATAYGGGLFDLGGGPALIRCTFQDNHADLSGGGVAGFGSGASLADCVLGENSAELSGGGIYDYMGTLVLDKCTIHGNVQLSSSGGAVGGGGMFSESGSPLLTRCTFVDNLASDKGGALYNKHGSANLFLCSILDNLAMGNGGGLYDSGQGLTASMCRIVANTTFGQGAGLYCDNANPELFDCTLHANQTYSSGGGVYVATGSTALTNCILWANQDSTGTDEDAQIFVAGGAAFVDYCCVQGLTGGFGGTGNIGDDPLFVDADGPDGIPGSEDDDLLLLPDSPCIDAGDNTAVPPDTADLDDDGDSTERIPHDLDGNPRFVDYICIEDVGVPDCPDYADVADIGAYEYRRGDLDGDHDVDSEDISIFVDVLNGTDTDPNHVANASMDCDDTQDGLDIQQFANTLVEP